MPDSNQYTPSDGQLMILQALWDGQPMTVREIHERINQQKKLAYTTTLKQVQRMLDKQWVSREETEVGHYYRALLVEDDIRQSLLDKLLRTAFRGAASELALSALGQVETTEEDLDALEEWLKQQRKHKS